MWLPAIDTQMVFDIPAPSLGICITGLCSKQGNGVGAWLDCCHYKKSPSCSRDFGKFVFPNRQTTILKCLDWFKHFMAGTNALRLYFPSAWLHCRKAIAIHTCTEWRSKGSSPLFCARDKVTTVMPSDLKTRCNQVSFILDLFQLCLESGLRHGFGLLKENFLFRSGAL